MVRESQEAVELTLKALPRASGIEPPRVHDVSPLLLSEAAVLPGRIRPHLEEMAGISRRLRPHRELAFYGTEDLTPSGFYGREDAERARDDARRVVELVRPSLEAPSGTEGAA